MTVRLAPSATADISARSVAADVFNDEFGTLLRPGTAEHWHAAARRGLAGVGGDHEPGYTRLAAASSPGTVRYRSGPGSAR